MKRVLCLTLALLMLLSLAACGGKGGKKGRATSIEDVLDNRVDYLMGKASKTQVQNMYPPEFWGDDFEAFWEEYQEDRQEMMEEQEEKYGKNVKYSYQILEKEKFDEEKVEQAGTYFEENWNIDPDSVTEGYNLTVEVIVKGSEKEDARVIQVSVAKIGNYWYDVSAL